MHELRKPYKKSSHQLVALDYRFKHSLKDLMNYNKLALSHIDDLSSKLKKFYLTRSINLYDYEQSINLLSVVRLSLEELELNAALQLSMLHSKGVFLNEKA